MTDTPQVSALRRWILPGLFVAGLFVAVFVRRPGPEDDRAITEITGLTMGTSYAVKVVTGPMPVADQQALQRAIEDTLAAVNGAMSTYQPDSELSTLNAAPTTDAAPASAPLRAVLTEALRIGRLSGGAFDVTVGPLVNAWGFGPDGEQTPPDAEAVAALRARVGLDKVAVVGEAVQKARPDVYVDLSAIAKGHGVDRIAQTLEARGHTEYLVEIGGELRARGRNHAGLHWRVGIEKPDPEARALMEVIALRDEALATSGDYRNFYEKDGKRVSHTIDPRTGRPIEHRLASVSVVHPSCATADALATALNVLGPDEGLALAAAEGLAALFIVREADGRYTEKVTPQFVDIREATAAEAPASP